MNRKLIQMIAFLGITAALVSLDIGRPQASSGVCCTHESDCDLEDFCCEYDEMGALMCSLDNRDYCLSYACPGPPR